MAIHPGDILAGYQVTQLLGRGGMGEVWAARSADGRHEVAIKVLLAKAALKPDLVARFEREAVVCASIDSEYVCRLLGHQRDENGTLCLIFERLEGESLSDRLKREVYLPFAEVGPLIDDTLLGLAAAHRAGVIHRDLKPGNIFLESTRDPNRPERAKVLDFGISKLSRNHDGRRDEPSLTDFDATLGSFAYMAPEQVRGAARVDHRCDVYAVGTVAFRALAGRLPFEGPSAGTVIALKLDRIAPSLSEATRDHWPAGLERFLARALQRDPEQRFASAQEAVAEWRACLPGAVTRRAAPPPARDGWSEASRGPTFAENPPTMTDPGGDWESGGTATEAGESGRPRG
ncbi:MAG: serine/threonine protein kinase [Deltaproteobacteria bacterium]|nr:serine/threonine protein kinase [Deltaproteobacteria bacterium]